MQKPDRSKLKYNEEKMRNAAKRPTLPFETGKDWYPFEVTDAEEAVGETDKTRGDMKINFQCAALKDIARAGDPTARLRPLMRDNFTVPVGNPDFPGHEPQDYHYGICEGRLLALFDEHELPRPPQRGQNGELLFKGKEIDKTDDDDARLEVMRHCVDLAEDLYFGADKGKAKSAGLRDRAVTVKELKGRLFLGKVGHSDDGQYVNIKAVRHIDRGLPKNGAWGPGYEGEGGEATPEVAAAPQRKSRSKKVSKKRGK